MDLLLSLSLGSKVIAKGKKRVQLAGGGGGGEFECKTCGRRFGTFQALGGHRTSHKRPRVRADGLELVLGAHCARAAARAAGVHRCAVCGAVFALGQALGGHMRRHRAEGSTAVWEATAGSGEEQEDDGIRPSCLLPLFV